MGAYEEMTAPPFASTPSTEGQRAKQGGRHLQEMSTGAPMAPMIAQISGAELAENESDDITPND